MLVGLFVERSLDMVTAILGILKAGGAYIPLDPEYPRERLSFMVQDSRASVLITQDKLKGNIDHDGMQVVCIDTDWEAIAREADTSLTGVQRRRISSMSFTPQARPARQKAHFCIIAVS